MKKTACLIILALILTAQPAQAADKADIDKMTTFAVLLGRAIACGCQTDTAAKQIGQWMDRKFPPGSQDQKTYLPVFITGVQQAAESQQNGQSPDTCAQVKKAFNETDWAAATK